MKKFLLLLAVLFTASGVRAQQGTFSNPNGGDIGASTTDCSAARGCVWQKLPGNASTSVVAVAGTFSATLLVEESANGGASWVTVATLTTTGNSSFSTNGFTDIRVRCSAFTSGIANVTINTGLLQVQSVVSSGGITSVSPPTAGLIGQYDLTTGLSGTTVADLSTAGNTLTFCGGGNAPTWDTAANGGGIIFGSSANQCINLPVGMNGALTFVIYAGFQFSDTGNGNAIRPSIPITRTIVGGTSGQATSLGWILFNSIGTDTWGNESQGGYRFRTTNTSVGNYLSSSFCPYNGNAVIALSLAPGADLFYINGTACALAQFASSVGRQSSGNLQLGATVSGYVGKIYYVLVYSGVLNAADIAKATQFERTIVEGKGTIGFVGTPITDTTDQVIAAGDSLTAGLLWPVPLLTGTWNVIDQGEGGRTAANIFATEPTDVFPVYRPGALRNLAINWSGTNAPSPATTVIANHRGFCQAFWNLGGKCVVSTMIDRAGNSLAHDLLNDQIHTFGPQYSDFICDQSANLHLGADGANANTTYFSDGIHLTTFADQNVAGPNFVHCINRVFGNTLQNGKYNTYKGNGVQIPTNRQFTSSLTFPWPVLSGSMLFANVTCQSCSGITISGITDTLLNTWTLVGSPGTSGNAKMQPLVALNSGAGADTITVTFTGGSGSNVFVTMGEWTGVLAAAALDVNSAIATGTSTAPASANITTTATGDLLLCYSGLALTAGGQPYTSVLSPYVFRSQSGNAMQADQVGGAAGSVPCSATLDSSLAWLAGAAAFKAAAGTSTFQAQDYDIYLECDPGTSNTGIALPDASWMTGYTVTVKNIQTAGANTCTVSGITPPTTGVAQTIDGAASVTVANKATLVVKSKLTFTGVTGTNLSPVSNWIQLQNN